MPILTCGLGLISIAFLIHLGVWKIRLPKRQTLALLWIFFGTFLLSIPFFEFVLRGKNLAKPLLPQNIIDYAHVFLFFTSFTLAYLITYSALEVDSPSLLIIKLIADAGPTGVEEETLKAKLSDDMLILPRINDLTLDKMAKWQGTRLQITPKGKWFVKMIMAYRSLLKASPGG
jgi:hypothetical protein